VRQYSREIKSLSDLDRNSLNLDKIKSENESFCFIDVPHYHIIALPKKSPKPKCEIIEAVATRIANRWHVDAHSFESQSKCLRKFTEHNRKSEEINWCCDI
jgi:hypothetical protein